MRLVNVSDFREIEGVLEKRCTKHELLFPDESPWFPYSEEYFYKSQNKNVKLFNYCKKCTIATSGKWKDDNRGQWINLSTKYREEGKQLEWQHSNKDKIQGYNKERKNKNHSISKKEWIACKNYFGNKCAYCGLPIEEHYYTRKGIKKLGDFHKEHVDHNGANDLSNCIPSCGSCNDKKWKHPFEEWYNPKNPVFSQERLNKINKWLKEDYKLYIKN